MITLEIIKKTVERVSNIKDISIKNRSRYLTDCRFVYCGLVNAFKEDLGHPSLVKVGNHINRNHATIIHGTNKFKDLYNVKTFAGTDIYNKCLIILVPLTDSTGTSGLIALTKEQEIKQYYSIRNAVLSSKYRSVINNLTKKLSLYRRNSFFDKVLELPPEDIKELEERFDVFFKVKAKLRASKTCNTIK